MTSRWIRPVVIAVAVMVASSCASGRTSDSSPSADAEPPSMRVATYNASLNRAAPGRLLDDLASGTDPQISATAEVVQRTRPDVMLINEFDYTPGSTAADLYRTKYLAVSQNGQPPVDYPYAFSAPVNTGVPTGRDLDGNGRIEGGNDAFGFGAFPGQYGMLILSKFPIDTAAARTFTNFLWKDMPGNLLPRQYYGANADILRLSSKSHWDVPVTVGATTVHLLVSHPTPPSFDGPEDRNGLRNHDEVRLTADYLRGGDAAEYIYDDQGVRGGLAPGSTFVVLGDQNSDPADGGSVPGTIAQLLELPSLTDPEPTSRGGAEAADPGHRTPAELDTADFASPDPGNLRVDYVLPSVDLAVTDSAVFWPSTTEDGASLMPPTTSSDHRLVWVDVTMPRR